MNQLSTLLSKRLCSLNEIIKACTQTLKKKQKGKLRVSTTGTRFRYYVKIGKEEKYLTKEERGLANTLAQQEYCQAVLSLAQKESRQIQRFLASYHPDAISQFYNRLRPARSRLISPLEVSDADFALQWQHQDYYQKPFNDGDPSYSTSRKERMRSKSEVLIAEAYARANVPYRYEQGIELSNGRTVFPDFTLLNVHTREVILHEHLGMLDNPEYLNHALQKLNAYFCSGYLPGKNLILTFETASIPFDPKTMSQIINAYF